MTKKLDVLQICPYEPPSSGWVNRVKLLRRVINERGGRCEILDIGPSRRIEREGCITVMDGGDYLRKVREFARAGFVVHCHVNGRYFRGLLLAIAALLINSWYRNRRVTTYHAGLDQPFLSGWRHLATWPFYTHIFALSHAVVCNSDKVRDRLCVYAPRSKIFSIPAFSSQYLEFTSVAPPAPVERARARATPLVSTYLCFRDGFYTDTLLAALPLIREELESFELLIIGTGDDREKFIEALEQSGAIAYTHLVGNLDHDQFMTILELSDIHLRTPTSDGVSSTVLESLSLQTPVVAAENGTRPPGVITYVADSPASLSEKLIWTMRNIAAVTAAIPADAVPDSAAVEVDLLAGNNTQPAQKPANSAARS